MKKYVIYINSESPSEPYRRVKNAYGYWNGKFYTMLDEMYPYHTFNNIIPETKRYSSRKRAENAVNNICKRCGYVYDCEIEEIEE